MIIRNMCKRHWEDWVLACLSGISWLGHCKGIILNYGMLNNTLLVVSLFGSVSPTLFGTAITTSLNRYIYIYIRIITVPESEVTHVVIDSNISQTAHVRHLKVPNLRKN